MTALAHRIRLRKGFIPLIRDLVGRKPLPHLFATPLRACGRWLLRSSDEFAVLAGATVFVVGIALVSVAVACMTGGLILAAFGVGRIAFQARSVE